ncbi:hypoxanthine phosphoribosyltransferase 1 [Blyttiomyces sp. JEL0837]|nr:hypoxanthine phosphoribosyltransferase 1 [Blyttiomyces sp. JEL0837]
MTSWIDITENDNYSLDHFLIPAHYAEDVESVMIPHGLIADRVEKLADSIARDCTQPLVACCVLKGASVFFADLMKVLKKLKNANNKSIPLSFEFIKVKSYINDESTGDVRISLTEDEMASFKGKDLLIVEDIVDSGATMVALIKRLKQYEPASIKVVSLLLKKTERSNKYIPDYVGFAIPDLFVVGYALDYNEVFRDLDHICVISEVGKVKYSTQSMAAILDISAYSDPTLLTVPTVPELQSRQSRSSKTSKRTTIKDVKLDLESLSDYVELQTGVTYQMKVAKSCQSLLQHCENVIIKVNLLGIHIADAASSNIICVHPLEQILKFSHNKSKQSFSYTYVDFDGHLSDFRFISEEYLTVFEKIERAIQVVIKIKTGYFDSLPVDTDLDAAKNILREEEGLGRFHGHDHSHSHEAKLSFYSNGTATGLAANTGKYSGPEDSTDNLEPRISGGYDGNKTLEVEPVTKQSIFYGHETEGHNEIDVNQNSSDTLGRKKTKKPRPMSYVISNVQLFGLSYSEKEESNSHSNSQQLQQQSDSVDGKDLKHRFNKFTNALKGLFTKPKGSDSTLDMSKTPTLSRSLQSLSPGDQEEPGSASRETFVAPKCVLVDADNGHSSKKAQKDLYHSLRNPFAKKDTKKQSPKVTFQSQSQPQVSSHEHLENSQHQQQQQQQSSSSPNTSSKNVAHIYTPSNPLFVEAPPLIIKHPKQARESIKSGTLTQLIQYLLDGDADNNYISSFLLTYRGFTQPITFLSTMEEILKQSIKEIYSGNAATPNTELLHRLVYILKRWAGDYPNDLWCPKVQPALEKLLGLLDIVDTTGESNQVRQILKVEIARVGSNSVTKKNAADTKEFLVGFDLTRLSAKKMAQQITLGKKLGGPFSIYNFIDRFNTISFWVATVIISTDDLRHRIDVLEKLIKIAYKTLEYQNYNGAYAILSGLSTAAVDRLKKTWDGLSSKHVVAFQEIQEKLSYKQNYKVYRELLESNKPPVIPILSLIMKDLTFTNEVNSGRLESGLINFEKFRRIYDLVSKVHTFQRHLPVLSEVNLLRLSKLLEPSTKASMGGCSSAGNLVTVPLNSSPLPAAPSSTLGGANTGQTKGSGTDSAPSQPLSQQPVRRARTQNFKGNGKRAAGYRTAFLGILDGNSASGPRSTAETTVTSTPTPTTTVGAEESQIPEELLSKPEGNIENGMHRSTSLPTALSLSASFTAESQTLKDVNAKKNKRFSATLEATPIF